MGDQQQIPAILMLADELEEGAKSGIFLGGILHHLVGDACELDNLLGNRHFGVDEGVEGVHYFPVFDFDRTDFGDAAILHGQTRGLDIENNGFLVHWTGAVSVERGGGVVDEVGLHTPNYLLTDFFSSQHGVLVGLDVAMVGDGNGGVSPFVGLLDQVRGRDDGVHGGHLGVDVKLYPLLFCLVLAGYAADFGNGVVVEQQVGALGAVAAHFPLTVTAERQHSAVGHHLGDGVRVFGEKIAGSYLDGGRVIGQIKGDVEFISLAVWFLGETKDLAQNHQVPSGLVNGGQRGGDDIEFSADGVLGGGNVKVHKADPDQAVANDGGMDGTASLGEKGLHPG